jgi:ABC-type phosphate transport system permease subunit
MGGANASMLALVAAAVTLGVGWIALHVIRAGFDYISTRGNPRNRAAAHETIRDIIIGTVLIVGAAAIAAFLFATMHFS